MLGPNGFGFVVVWLAVLLGIASAIEPSHKAGPTRKESKQTASIPAADAIAKGRRNGPLEYHRTLSKYNIPIPDRLDKLVNRYMQKLAEDTNGSVPAISQNGDLEWVSPVHFGTPAQQLYLDFDTGSADTWVFSNDTSAKMVKGQTIFDISQSTTAQLIPNCSWNIMYGDFSSSSGIAYKDTLAIGDLVIEGMTVESAKQVSAQFSNQNDMSGLLGLAFGSIIQTEPSQKALIDFLPDVLHDPIFTTDLRHNSSDGTYNFGFIDHNLHSSDIEYIGIDKSRGFWEVQMKGFAVGDGSRLSYEFINPHKVILDTGSTLFFAPDQAVHAYYSNHVREAIFSKEEFGWIIPCNSTPPSFIWELTDDDGNNVQGEVPGSYLPYAVLEGKGHPEGYCYSGLQMLDGDLTSIEAIFGDIFLKSGFQVWDVGQERVGFAPKPLPPLKAEQEWTDDEKVPGAYHGRRDSMAGKPLKILLI